MEPSQASGKYSGNNESGWTAYIGSHIRTETNYSDDDDDDDDEVKSVEEAGNDGHDNDDDDDDDDESDDSMTSDASSGPSHLQYLGINSGGTHGCDHHHQFTKHKENDHKSLFSGKRTSKQASKRTYGKNVEVKEEEEEDEDDLVEAHSAASSHI